MIQSRRHNSPGPLQDLQEAPPEIFPVPGIHQDTQGAVPQGLTAAIQPAAQNRQAAGHGLQKDEAKAFALARHDVGVRQAVMVRLLGFGNKAGKHHPLAHSQAPGLLSQTVLVITIAHDEIGDFGIPLRQGRQQFQNLVDPLVPLRGR